MPHPHYFCKTKSCNQLFRTFPLQAISSFYFAGSKLISKGTEISIVSIYIPLTNHWPRGKDPKRLCNSHKIPLATTIAKARTPNKIPNNVGRSTTTQN